MNYVTFGKGDSGFCMPIVLSRSIDIPKAGMGYYSIVVCRGGAVDVKDAHAHQLFSAPGLLCITPSHSIEKISYEPLYKEDAFASADGLFCLVFRPDGLNSTFTEFPDTFEYHSLKWIADGYRYFPVSPEIMERVVQNCRSIEHHLNIEQGESWPCLTRSYILETILLIDRIEYTNQVPSQSDILPIGQKMQSIFQFVHTSLQQELTLDVLSRQFATNRTTLNRWFNQICGMSAMAYVCKIRLETALLMLRNTELSVSAIAERTGFSDESYFTRVFRKKMGITPREFRKSVPVPYNEGA